jgi:glutathione peroxidase
MWIIKPLLIAATMLFTQSCLAQPKTNTPMSIYDIKINALDDQPIDIKAFKGKYLLIVNVASECGFTGQYDDLQKLYDTYKDQLMVIGVPCNQFGGQEPGSASEIQSFCKRNYGVTFQITEKVDVKGKQQHPLYEWLTQKQLNGKKGTSVKWNFQKYLIGPDGEYIDYFYSITKPMSRKITRHFI